MIAKPRATIEDLYSVQGKAEIVNEELVVMSTGYGPGLAATKIVISLGAYQEAHGGGGVLADNVGYVVHLPNRDSLCPDASWFTGNLSPTSMKFVEGAAIFAVEVRSENDYGPKADRAIEVKIADYFAAGTQVVWYVDLLGEDVVSVYRDSDPTHPTIYRRGDVAEAEPAVPGWTFAVDKLFA